VFYSLFFKEQNHTADYTGCVPRTNLEKPKQ